VRGVRGLLGAVGTLSLAAGALVVDGPGAQAYPEPVCPATVSAQHVVGGDPITVSGSSAVSRTWTVSFAGHTVTGRGTTIAQTFATPTVTSARTLVAHVRCDDSGDQPVPVTLVPPGSGAPPAHHPPAQATRLPHTGGPSRSLLTTGVGLLVAGIGLLVVRRSRHPGAR
jgi:LPXTG-motif cell wall-anchored protein